MARLEAEYTRIRRIHSRNCRIQSNRPEIHWSVFSGRRIHSNLTEYTRTAAEYTRTAPNTLGRRIHSNKKSAQKSKKMMTSSKKTLNRVKNPPPDTLERAEYTRTHICRFFSMVPGRVCHKVHRGGDAIDSQAADKHACTEACGMLSKLLQNAGQRLSEGCQNACKMLSECFRNAVRMPLGCLRNAGRQRAPE